MSNTFEKMIESKFAPDHIDIEENIKCRYFSIVLSQSLTERHYKLITEFIHRHIKSPRGGCTGPWEENDTYNHLQFYLNEEVADEYLERMKNKD